MAAVGACSNSVPVTRVPRKAHGVHSMFVNSGPLLQVLPSLSSPETSFVKTSSILESAKKSRTLFCCVHWYVESKQSNNNMTASRT